MKRNLWVVAAMTVLMMTAVGARSARAGDLPRPDKLKMAETAELKGDLARVHERYADAIGQYRLALRAVPENAKLQNKLGITYLQMGNKPDARKAFSRAVKLDRNFANALNNLGAVECLEKKYNPAIRHLKEALALDESSASAHLNMAEAWIGLGQMERAMMEYARALELNADILSGSREGVLVNVTTPEQRARIDYLLAKAYAKRGNVEGALEYLRRAKEYRYADLAKVYQDEAFASLWEDPRLQKIVKR